MVTKVDWPLGEKTVSVAFSAGELPQVSVVWSEEGTAVSRKAETSYRFSPIASHKLQELASAFHQNFYPTVSRLSDGDFRVSFSVRGLGGGWRCCCCIDADNDDTYQQVPPPTQYVIPEHVILLLNLTWEDATGGRFQLFVQNNRCALRNLNTGAVTVYSEKETKRRVADAQSAINNFGRSKPAEPQQDL